MEPFPYASDPPGAALLARLPADRLDALLRQAADQPCPSRDVDAHLKALGITKLGHRLQIQQALKVARERSAATFSHPRDVDDDDDSMPILELNKTPQKCSRRASQDRAHPSSPLADVTNQSSAGHRPAPSPKRALGVSATPEPCRLVADESEPESDLGCDLVLESNDLFGDANDWHTAGDGGAPTAPLACTAASSLEWLRTLPLCAPHSPSALLRTIIVGCVGLWLCACVLALRLGLGLSERLALRTPLVGTHVHALLGRVRVYTGIVAT